MLAIGLRLEGFEVAEAHSGDEALALLESASSAPFDLALVDLMMPTQNGLELARQLRRQYPLVRVVMTSAYRLSEGQLARADCGVIGFVPKPCSLAELARFLRAKLSAKAEGPRSQMLFSGHASANHGS
jgi:DNA-binding response OmpR family regulator